MGKRDKQIKWRIGLLLPVDIYKDNPVHLSVLHFGISLLQIMTTHGNYWADLLTLHLGRREWSVLRVYWCRWHQSVTLLGLASFDRAPHAGGTEVLLGWGDDVDRLWIIKLAQPKAVDA